MSKISTNGPFERHDLHGLHVFKKIKAYHSIVNQKAATVKKTMAPFSV